MIWIARAVCIPQVGTIFQQILGVFFALVSSANFLHVHSTKHIWCMTLPSKITFKSTPSPHMNTFSPGPTPVANSACWVKKNSLEKSTSSQVNLTSQTSKATAFVLGAHWNTYCEVFLLMSSSLLATGQRTPSVKSGSTPVGGLVKSGRKWTRVEGRGLDKSLVRPELVTAWIQRLRTTSVDPLRRFWSRRGDGDRGGDGQDQE